MRRPRTSLPSATKSGPRPRSGDRPSRAARQALESSPAVASRLDLEAREARWLAPYAMKSAQTRGRVHPEPEDPFRTVYRRDHDRIVHSTAFRRLEYKTQVFVNHEGDYYRTRLTHTLEVAQIAVSIARTLRLNEDLVETLALAHDLGHPPFGHAGEEALRDLMKGYGGFEHNLQGLRIVDLLEQRYPGFAGLNLTWEVRESINKHRAPYDQPGLEIALDPALMPLLESQAADIADEIAYDNHDLDDGLTSGLIKERELEAFALWEQARAVVESRAPRLDPEIRKYQIIRELINRQITDLVQESTRRLAQRRIGSVDDVRRCPERLIGFSDQMQRLRQPLKSFLWDNLYHHYRVVRMADKARRLLGELFELYVRKPEQLPNTTRSRIARGEDAHRVVCDYLAGMTDRYCLEEHRKLFDPFERV
ncbi:MAG: deoxyguanosinetriphosphate triphosphohydrolase [Candidatus Omnitrophica bacterium]|nr:deoxyguanosinetriphosphate triphosphohydrolase [Candidatus Omnitrophota bacterium]